MIRRKLWGNEYIRDLLVVPNSIFLPLLSLREQHTPTELWSPHLQLSCIAYQWSRFETTVGRWEMWLRLDEGSLGNRIGNHFIVNLINHYRCLTLGRFYRRTNLRNSEIYYISVTVVADAQLCDSIHHTHTYIYIHTIPFYNHIRSRYYLHYYSQPIAREQHRDQKRDVCWNAI